MKLYLEYNLLSNLAARLHNMRMAILKVESTDKPELYPLVVVQHNSYLGLASKVQGIFVLDTVPHPAKALDHESTSTSRGYHNSSSCHHYK